MLLSLGLIFLVGFILGKVFVQLKLPSLVGMLLTGIVLGPYVLDILDDSILGISTELRQIALIIILTRAGLNLNIQELKKVGRPAIMMCFLPACFEITGMLILAPIFFQVSFIEAAIMGTVLAAVSPAVIVPRMLNLMENGYGRDQGIPQMIMASGSVDDVIVIVLFTASTSLATTGSVSVFSFMVIPSSIILGLLIGIVGGLVMCSIFTRLHIRDSEKVLMLLAVSFFFLVIEEGIQGNIGFSGLLAVMAMGATIQFKKKGVAIRLGNKFGGLWTGAELLLFVLVGATVNIHYAWSAGFQVVALILAVLGVRMLGVGVALLGSSLSKKERAFSAIAYMPKATVQAAIGGLPLAMGLACGELVLTMAVISILITAPLGAKLIDISYKKLLLPHKE